MSETRLEIVLSAEDAPAALERIQAQLPADAELIETPLAASPGLGEMLSQALAASADLPGQITDWWTAAAAGPAPGPMFAVVYSALILAAAYGVERAVAAGAARLLPVPSQGEGYGARIRAALRWALFQAAGIVVFAGLAVVVGAAMTTPGTAFAAIFGVLFDQTLRVRVLLAVTEALSGSRDPSRRLIGFTDEEARFAMRCIYAVIAVVVTADLARGFLQSVVGAGESAVFVAIASDAVRWLAVLVVFVFLREPVARLAKQTFAPTARPGGLADWVATNWWALYVPVFLLSAGAFALSQLDSASGPPNPALTFSGLIVVLAPLAVAAIRIWRDDRLSRLEGSRQGVASGLFALLEGIVVAAAALLLLASWGIDPFATGVEGPLRFVPRLVNAFLVLVVGHAVWRMAAGLLEAYAPASEADPTVLAGVEGGGPGGGRLETVFPILRAAAAILIWGVTVMLALAALGLEILPLLAGAGILGLAVGFGAQTLVKDVISGVFYLWEDAFRVGEFIETAEGKGMVEKILLRSARLRHPRGAIYTVPFGSMGTIRNHSRDWVKVKFTFDVEPSEDLEKVRKLVKKVGAALAEDPELEGRFIEPMKSQGAVAMSGSNYQIGVKFICPPGQQFLIRRKAFALLQKAFKENGVALAQPKVNLATFDPSEPAAGRAQARPAAE